ncbi:type II toxin-antitoxin system RelE/ParE family toxin [Streptomyces sp. I05A-00742]|uniref:type II toxin-antitoxin system RelE family toxin n=1 Tax=Streptomyces sp. I05A-00742 TaxID=2732853 RepID=UPI00148832F2|nr:type II toxin-antitoxin system RelE/ParE family toxin [Streptomyces sp. I05A-00742]
MTWTVVWEHHSVSALRRLRPGDPTGAKLCVAAVRELADDPCPEGASPLGESGYHRLAVGAWRVLYLVSEDTVRITNLGRVV